MAPASDAWREIFATAQERLVKGMRVAGVKTIEQANQYLTDDHLVSLTRCR